MKFYIYSGKEYAEKDLSRLENLIKRLYNGAEVEIGKNRLAKYKQERFESEGGLVLKSEDVLVRSNKESAINIINLTGVGISESVLGKL